MGRREGISREVQKARAEGDSAALSRMGRKGGIEAADRRAVEKAEREEELEKLRIAIAKLYSLKDGNVMPPDDPTVDGIVYH